MTTTTDTATTGFVLNGTPVQVRADHPHLLAALREELDITSVKDGCSPSGQCGCCTVMIDGKVQISCTYDVAKAGVEEGIDSLGQSCIVAPSGQIVAQSLTTGDELIVARCDLDMGKSYKSSVFNFAMHREPQAYGLIVERKGAVSPV